MNRVGVVAVLALGACGDNLEGVGFAEFPAERDRAWCDHAVRCGAIESSRCTEPGVVGFSWDDSTIRGVATGSIIFDEQKAHRCLETIRTSDCDRLTPDDPAGECDYFSATLGAGEACLIAAECLSNECWLENTSCDQACCMGHCVGDEVPALAQIGESCRLAPCAEGWCNDSQFCKEWSRPGEACEVDIGCEPGHWCYRLICVPVVERDGHCEVDYTPCRLVGDRCVLEEGACVPARRTKERCQSDRECIYPLSCLDFECERRQSDVGERCSSEADCDDDSFCHGVCASLGSAGEDCQHYTECVSGNCDYNRGICVDVSTCGSDA